MAQITSERLRKLLTKGESQGLAMEDIVKELRARGHNVDPDTVRKVSAHYRTKKAAVTDSAQAAAPAESTPVAAAPPSDAAEAVAAAAPMQEPESTPAQTGQSILHAAGQALPGTLATFASLAAPELIPAAAAAAPVLGALRGVMPMVGAGVGGSLGEAGRQLIEGQPLDPNRIADEGGTQLGLMGLGQGAANAAAGTGKLFLRGALRNAPPEVIATAIREKIAATRAGAEKLTKLLNIAGDSQKKIAQEAAAQGIKADLPTIVKDAAREVYESRLQRGLDPLGDKKQLQTMAREYLTQRKITTNPAKPFPRATGLVDNFGREVRSQRLRITPPPRSPEATPPQLLKLRQGADDIAGPIFKKAEQAQRRAEVPLPSADESLKAEFAKAVADRERAHLNAIGFDPLTGTGPMAEVNSYISELKQLQSFIGKNANESRLMAALRAGAPVALGGGTMAAITPGDAKTKALAGLGGAAAGRALSNPGWASTIGVGLNNPGLIQALTRFPQLAGIAASQF